MKHKLLAIFLASVMTAGVLTGCGGSSAKNDTSSAETADKSEEKSSDGSTAVDEKTASQAVDEETAKAAGFTDGEEEAGGSETDNAREEASGAETTVLDTDSELSGKHHAEIVIKDYGQIDVELDADAAPITVTNFVKLVQEGFYDGLTFHRIMDGFMMQGGDPLGNGTGGSEETIKGEFSENGVKNELSHTRGAVSMARSSAMDSASSQFFIVQSDSTFLDGQYAAFGYVTEGMEIVDQICKKAEPTDDNGTIPASEQPVIETIKIID